MVRGQLLKPNLARLIRRSEFVEPNGVDKLATAGFDVQVGDRYYLLERRDSVCNIFDVGRNVEFLSLVDVTVNSEQYLRFDLTKPIQDGGRAELCSATRPDRSYAGRSQHCDRCFLYVRHVTSDSVTSSYPFLT